MVRTWLKNVRESVIVFGYELVRADSGALLAEGETTHIVTDAKMKIAALAGEIFDGVPRGDGNIARRILDGRARNAETIHGEPS